jgi:argininosuccinate lyase
MSSNESDEAQKAYWQARDHHRHTCGCEQADDWLACKRLWHDRFTEVRNRLPYCGKMDMAWLVMLHKQGLVPTETVRKLVPVLRKTKDEAGWGGEIWIRDQLDGDEDTAAAVNYGRTLQEPMARMQMRDQLINTIDEAHRCMQVMLDVASENTDTLMPGHSHWAQAQPTTYAAYLLAIHDGLSRGLEQLELAYRHTNQNSGGCGACSGTGWPVDRNMVTELLGFDETIELTFDCEGSQDEMLTSLFAASNMGVTLSRIALDMNVWVTEEWDIFEVDMAYRGVSSFMPQKANAGNRLEHIRQEVNDILGAMHTCLHSFKNEPLQDVLTVYQADRYVHNGLGHLQGALAMLRYLLPNITPRKERMWEMLRRGYSGAPDLSITMIRQKGFGGRCAHRICATMVRIARERGIKACECTGALLDEAARISGDPEPHLTDAEVQDSMSLENFFEKHQGLGDPNPTETGRLVEVRRTLLAESIKRNDTRKERLAKADKKLQTALEAIIA